MVKIFISLLFGLTLIYLTLGVYRGRVIASAAGKRDNRNVRSHRACFKKAALPLLLAIIAVELMVRLLNNASYPILFPYHLLFAVCFLGLFLTVYFIFNGLKNPRIHAKLGYACFLLYILTYITGMILLIKI